MLRDLSLHLECGSFQNKSWRTYHRASEAAKLIIASGDKDWKSSHIRTRPPSQHDVSDVSG